MTTVVAQLDKLLNTALGEGHGTIMIRVVVLAKNSAAAAAPNTEDTTPIDVASDEILPDTDKRPISAFLEEPKRGKQCCVFLINGQRQHAWDNHFIVRDLELKYLRNRMIVVVECDGLKPEAIAELMQGSRHQFYEGTVYSAVEARVIATLKGDPDLRRLEEEAEDDISSLQAGDEIVKAALDQLIEAHHDSATRAEHGHVQGGAQSRQEGNAGELQLTQEVVMTAAADVGAAATEPVLNLSPDVATVRLRPKEMRRITLYSRPESAWPQLESMLVTVDPPVPELQIARTSQINCEDVQLTFAEAEDLDDDEYPIETVLRILASFRGHAENRIIERRLVVNPSKKRQKRPRPPLTDDPSVIKVTSRQPIKIIIGGPDVHIKLRWDGKDELVSGNPALWTLRASCESTSIEPQTYLTKPNSGRFELLVQASTQLRAGEQLKFDLEAIGPGKTLTTTFVADVVEAPSPRKLNHKTAGGGQRRPPYELMYVKRGDWGDETCWGGTWSATDPGSFEEPSARSPMKIFVNQDLELLATYRESLLTKKQAETTIQQRINKYTTHVAFHLYQMYENKKQAEAKPNDGNEPPSDDQMRDEIQRVSRTLIKLMEVAG